jgi:hypothetical protein
MTTILGYKEQPLRTESEDNEPEYDYHSRSYIFSPIKETPRGSIVTASVMICAECSTIIKSMGGPGYRCYCLRCYDALKLFDFSEGHEHEMLQR